MRIAKRLAALAALLAVAAMPAPLAAERADVAVYAGGVDFLPNVAYRQAVLTVSGNGQSYRWELPAGRPLSIGMFDPDGQPLADGVYSWQLELVPTEATAEALRGRELAPWKAESGTFTIRGGVIADPALAEPTAIRSAETEGLRSSLEPGSFGAGRPDGGDDDAAVGYRADAESRLNAAAARQAPAASALLGQPDPAAGDDSDTRAAALGRSLERAAAASDHQLSAPSRAFAPRPRSDGSNGRPRSR